MDVSNAATAAAPLPLTPVPHAAALMAAVVVPLEPPGDPLDPATPSRCICRLNDGQLILGDVAGKTLQQIGPSVREPEAAELARAVLAGSSLAVTAPSAVHMLAVAYLALAATALPRAHSGG